ncbi:MAG TPA: Rv2578c family radical SAM protein [Nocardioidaceae bacterium]|nr:Rv2578c family radical SAM protein [Nocardioidaceae bacterium]
MRWEAQALQSTDESALPGMDGISALVPGLIRSVTTPDFAGITFHEVAAKSALNKVPATSAMPFRWTVNPWRGCSHACFYCYARGSHTWLELDSGHDFDTQIVVKTNVAAVLRRELGRPSWRHEQVALGTNTDPYQRAEGRYRLMPGIIDALAESRTPFSILTKGTLLRRDLPRLAAAAEHVGVGLGISLALLDEDLHASLEPGTPSPRARLDLVRAVRACGLDCGVMVAPVLPWLTDSTEALDRLLAALADAGASGVTVLPLHLRPGAREWYLGWLQQHRPDLLPRYRRLYGRGSYVGPEYRDDLRGRVRPLLHRYGFGRAGTRSVDEEHDEPSDAVAAPAGTTAATLF